jgi:hypothetical protein
MASSDLVSLVRSSEYGGPAVALEMVMPVQLRVRLEGQGRRRAVTGLRALPLNHGDRAGGGLSGREVGAVPSYPATPGAAT